MCPRESAFNVHAFLGDTVLVRELKEDTNRQLEIWRQVWETRQLSRNI